MMLLGTRSVQHPPLEPNPQPSSPKNSMCRPPSVAPHNVAVNDPQPPSNGLRTTTRSSFVGSPSSSSLLGLLPLPSRRAVGVTLLSLFIVGVVAFGLGYTFSLSFRRSIIFWRGMAPIWLEYKWIKFQKPKATPSRGSSNATKTIMEQEFDARLRRYYAKTADRLVALILELGGIATKIGQLLGTVGQGLLPAEIVSALRILQDGVPPKPYDEIAGIIEDAAGDGRTMDDIFEWFDPKPLGAASIAQAHRAGLKHSNNRTVVVKVQYPEVAKQLKADLWNTEMAIRLISPSDVEFAKHIQKRHQQELDFRQEAQNLRDIRRNLQAHGGMEPNLVRVPEVYNETGLCQRNVLIMEYLPGTPLSQLLKGEQDRLARALGKASAAELQSYLTEQLLQGKNDNDVVAEVPPALQVLSTLPLAGKLFRVYAHAKDNWDRLGKKLSNAFVNGNKNPKESRQLVVPHHHQHQRKHVNLNRLLQTLVHVQGLQFLIDGVYNADPHPGNVLLMPDGRVGLLDFGMVGRLSDQGRLQAAQTVLALSRNDRDRVAQLYKESGYRAFRYTTPLTDPAILHRFASFHLDRIDLSRVHFANANFTINGQDSYDVLQLLQGVMEQGIPDWIEDGRRLGALLMGPYTQTAQSLRLSRAWAGLAKQAVRQHQPNPRKSKRTG